MTLTCSKCSRINPADAIYCYFDGIALDGQGRSGPVAMGSQPFVSPFVFTSGRSCRSFDELAMACQENWKEATDALKQGFMGSFFGGIGRADLAQAASEAAGYPDVDRGLDQLLAQLPTSVLDEPKLQLSTTELNLGQMKVGEDRELKIDLENQGMRLLYGTASSVDSPWITLGEGAGGEEKIFQFGDQFTLPIHIKGEKLRAGNKPLEGKIVISSNGGEETIIVRAEVPVTPFPSGVLEGARTPRQIAEKANKKPKAAAIHFEKGEVPEWYRSNGWTYPVQGPASSGLSAVQQFFEALGLTPAPKVRINTTAIELTGEVGQELRYVIEVQTKEKKPVYAHGTSNQEWIDVSRAKLSGRFAKIGVAIPSVPNCPGQTLTGKIIVQSNGNQRFVIPVTLHVNHSLNFDFDSSEPAYQPPPAPVPIVVEDDETPEASAPVPLVVEEEGDAPAKPVLVPEPVAEEEPKQPVIPAPKAATPVAVTSKPSSSSPGGYSSRRRAQLEKGKPLYVHLIPSLLLGLALVILLIVDLASGGATGGQQVSPVLGRDSKTGAYLLSTENDNFKPDKSPIVLDFTGQDRDLRFGLVMRDEPDPKNPALKKRLTSDKRGAHNNTIVKINGFPFPYGRVRPGKWVRERLFNLDLKENLVGKIWTMRWDQFRISVTQHVQLLPGQTGTLDTCLVLYRIANEEEADKPPHQVGIRVMLDTYIGGNDGVPFLIPGEEKLADSLHTLRGNEIPSYIEAIENPNQKSASGTVVRLGLKGLSLPGTPKLDPIDRVVICAYDGPRGWDWKFKSMKSNKDSCVVLYWDVKDLKGGQERYVGFTFGLSGLDFDGEKSLVLSVPSNIYAGKEFIVTSYVYDTIPNQEVELILPDGFRLAEGEKLKKLIKTKQKRATVHWKVIPPKEKNPYEIRARSRGDGARIKIEVKGSTIFG